MHTLRRKNVFYVTDVRSQFQLSKMVLVQTGPIGFYHAECFYFVHENEENAH